MNSPVSAGPITTLHPTQYQTHIKPVNATLHVMTMVSNPIRYASRYRLYQAFEKMVADAGATLWTVEVALRHRHFEITDSHNPHHVQLRSPDILWLKESAQNVGVRHMSVLEPNWEYVLFLDADVQIARPDWAVELVHLLQTYTVVQPWSHNISLGPSNQPISDCTSFAYNWSNDEAILQPFDRKQGKPAPRSGFVAQSWSDADGDGSHHHPPHPPHPPKPVIHTGYGLAFRREALSALGGLGDIGILGSGDRHMMYALVGEVDKSFPGGLSSAYKNYWLRWQERAEKFVRRNVGYMEALLLDGWHGAKVHRRYQDRWKILETCHFDPDTDITHDVQGLIQFSGANPRLERACRQYFGVRAEDSIDL